MSFEDEKRSIIERKRHILFLISKYLIDAGYNSTNNELISEAKLSSNYELCDNVDLESIYLEYCSYYQLKLGKKPKILKKIDKSLTDVGDVIKPSTKGSPTMKPSLPKRPSVEKPCKIEEAPLPSLQIFHINTDGTIEGVKKLKDLTTVADDYVVNRLEVLRSKLDYPEDMREIVQAVLADVVDKKLGIHWSDVCGAETAKTVLREGIILPQDHPELFNDVTTPWKSALLYGPPGTGKTLIAKALCTETFGKLMFFNISPSTIISKWRGESEKIIRVLFDVAKKMSPSIVFIDEIDSITSQRDKLNEHEASKRFKTEFLTLMDGLESIENSGVFLLASTNLPWDIDHAFLRRFEQKVLLDLPNDSDRISMIQKFLPSNKFDLKSLDMLSHMSLGLTGDELRLACKELKMIEIRRAVESKNFGGNNKTSPTTVEDAIEVFKKVKPFATAAIKKHREWSKNFTNL